MTGLRRLAAAALGLWDRLAPRERTLVSVGAALVVAVLAVRVGLAVRNDFAALDARVAAAEHELAEVRRLAARLGPAATGATTEAPLVTRLERTAEGVVGRERIATIAPADEQRPDAGQGLRVSDASLPEIVRLLHALEVGPPPLGVARLEITRHPDDRARFGVRVEVAP